MASQMKDVRAPEWLYHRHSSERQFQTHSPGWQDGRWCGGNNESLSGALFSTLFSLHQRIFLNFLLFFSLLPPPPHTHSFSSSSTSLCLSVLCGVSTVVITLLTDAGLQAMQHLSTSLSLRSHCQTYTFALKHLPRYHGARSQSLIFGKKKQRHARTGTWHVSSFSHD